MTPQELMDLPYAGQADGQCVKDGKWDEDVGELYNAKEMK